MVVMPPTIKLANLRTAWDNERNQVGGVNSPLVKHQLLDSGYGSIHNVFTCYKKKIKIQGI
jgi:hypothetical protein